MGHKICPYPYPPFPPDGVGDKGYSGIGFHGGGRDGGLFISRLGEGEGRIPSPYPSPPPEPIDIGMGKGLGHYFHILNVFFRDYVRRAYR